MAFSFFARRHPFAINRATMGPSDSKWYQPAYPLIAQIKSAPGHEADIKAEEQLAEHQAAYPQMRGDRAAEQARHQDRTERGGARDRIEDRTDPGDDPEWVPSSAG